MAASLNAQNGIRVFDVGRGYHPLPSETQYGASSYWVDFDRSGRLVTTSYDGFSSWPTEQNRGSAMAYSRRELFRGTLVGAATAAFVGAYERPVSAQTSLTPETALQQLIDGKRRFAEGGMTSFNE